MRKGSDKMDTIQKALLELALIKIEENLENAIDND
jgi:hypothetical protein